MACGTEEGPAWGGGGGWRGVDVWSRLEPSPPTATECVMQ